MTIAVGAELAPPQAAVAVDLTPYVQATGDGRHTLHLMVEGVHCGGCVRRIERALRADPAVAAARVNLTTRRLAVTWHGPRKDDPRIEAYGEVDDPQRDPRPCAVRKAAALIEQTLAAVQNELFAVGAELASPDPIKAGTAWIDEPHIVAPEQAIDALEEQLPPLEQFILPAGNRAACTIHVARVCVVVRSGDSSRWPMCRTRRSRNA